MHYFVATKTIITFVNTLGLINDKGPNPPREGHLSRAELNIELRGPGFESTGKPVITYDHKIKKLFEIFLA